MTDIAVIILTKNEKLHIGRCLERLRDLNPRQIFVVDCFSTDETKSIVKSYVSTLPLQLETSTISFIEHEWPGLQSVQFNWALDNLLIDSKWVLRLDADEYLTPESIEWLIVNLDNIDDKVDALEFTLERKFMGGEIRHGTNGIQMVRMFRRRRGRYAETLMDERIAFEGEKLSVPVVFYDDNLNTLEWWKEKHRGYAKREAQQAIESMKSGIWIDPRKASYYKLPRYLRAVLYFCIRYFLKLGFLDGLAGFRWHFWQGLWYRWLVDREISRLRSKDIWGRLIHDMDESYLASSTMQLLSLDKSYKPHVWGSGMLYKSPCGLHVLTVLHNALLDTTTIQGQLVRYNNGLKMANRLCKGWKIVKDCSFTKDLNRGDPRLDFSFAATPANETYSRWSYDDEHGLQNYPIKRFSASDVLECSVETMLKQHKYSFCGTTSPCDPKEPVNICGAEVILVKYLSVMGLEYVKMDDYYIYFRLPAELNADINYAGTSGAPILADNGYVIALVCGGDEGNLVRGIRLDLIFKLGRPLVVEDLQDVKKDHMDELLSFLDDEQRHYYWGYVDKGMTI